MSQTATTRARPIVGPRGAASPGARFILRTRTTAMVLAADINTMAPARRIRSIRSSTAPISWHQSYDGNRSIAPCLTRS